MNNEWSATRGTSGPKHTVRLPTDGSKAACWLSEHVRQKKATSLWTSHANTCIQYNSEEISNILRWQKIRGCDSESAGVFFSDVGQRLTWTVFFCVEFARVPEQPAMCLYARCPSGGDLHFSFHFVWGLFPLHSGANLCFELCVRMGLWPCTSCTRISCLFCCSGDCF